MTRVYPSCTRCGGVNGRRHRWCRDCINAYNRDRRRYANLTDAQRHREIARAYANVYLRRGHLQREPCCLCGDPGTEMHHSDYDRPLHVRWLCTPCHRAVTRDTEVEISVP